MFSYQKPMLISSKSENGKGADIEESISPIMLELSTAFLLILLFLAISKIQSSQDLNVTVRLSPIALSVAMITSKIWPSYACMTLLSFHCCYIDDFASWAILGSIFHRNSTSVTQKSQVLIWQSNILLPLLDCTTMLLLQSLIILLWGNTSWAKVCATVYFCWIDVPS